MLNREHLRLHRRADRALPTFADTADPDLLAAAESVLAIFRSGTGKKLPNNWPQSLLPKTGQMPL